MHWIKLAMYKSGITTRVNLVHASQIIPQQNTKSTMIYFAAGGTDIDSIQVQETIEEIFSKEVVNV